MPDQAPAATTAYQQLEARFRRLYALGQAAGILGFKTLGKKPEDGSIYLFAGADNVRFKRQVVPGDQLIIKVDYVSDRRGIWKFNCSSYVGDALAASATVLCADRKV